MLTKHDIINLEQYADALRSTGYKNIESAVSEIVDNSLEAEASDVFILVRSKAHEVTGHKHVYEIAFLDNGFGMGRDLVQSCLRIGYGTRANRKGMGRFGVGLPQASMHVCPLVEVYSWQNGIENCYKSFLDISKIKSGDQKYFEHPEKVIIPKTYQRYIRCLLFNKNFDFASSGTLVIWKNCDNVSPKTVTPLFNRLEFSLGQKFRHWISEGKSNLFLLDIDNHSNNINILPNDPLLLMNPNYVLGNEEKPQQVGRGDGFNESIFEPFSNGTNTTGLVDLPVTYIDKNTQEIKSSIVKIRFSIIKSKFYDTSAVPVGKNPGDTPLGKHVKKLEGISVVRAGREVDFGRFDFYEVVNEPFHRWWGCEISFEPELDEVFGVANNKQHVELIELDPNEYAEDEVKPIWFQLKRVVSDTIKAMTSRNTAIRKGSRMAAEKPSKTSELTINKVEGSNHRPTESEEVRRSLSEEELVCEAKKTLEIIGIIDPTPEDITELLLNKVNIVYKANNRAPFLDYETSLGICKCIINTDHVFYKKFMTHIEHDDEARVAFELFLASLIRARDEIMDDTKKDMYDEVIADWNAKLTQYIRGL